MNIDLRLKIDYYLGGAIHLLVKPLVMLLGYVMRRDHDLRNVRDITIVKLLGGGSLVLAYPSLLALKQRASPGAFRLVTLDGTKSFAELLGVFDEIIVIRDRSALTLAIDAVRAIGRLWKCDVLIDLEVHSRLSTIFCLATCARNRVGFYTVDSFWRKSLATHLLFFHLNSLVHLFYEQIIELFATPSVSVPEARVQFQRTLGFTERYSASRIKAVAVAPCCSSLGRERMLSNEQWVTIFTRDFAQGQRPQRIDLLGGPDDARVLDSLRSAMVRAMPECEILNHAGKLSLKQSAEVLWKNGTLYTIDSSLLHIAQLLEVRCVSFWGPTAPQTRLALPVVELNEIHYGILPCSPCVHVAASPPCHGNNICMQLAADPAAAVNRNPPWLAQEQSNN